MEYYYFVVSYDESSSQLKIVWPNGEVLAVSVAKLIGLIISFPSLAQHLRAQVSPGEIGSVPAIEEPPQKEEQPIAPIVLEPIPINTGRGPVIKYQQFDTTLELPNQLEQALQRESMNHNRSAVYSINPSDFISMDDEGFTPHQRQLYARLREYNPLLSQDDGDLLNVFTLVDDK